MSLLSVHRTFRIEPWQLWLGLLTQAVVFLSQAVAQPASFPGLPAPAGERANASAAVFLWGIQSGCEVQDQTTKNVADLLVARGLPVQFLRDQQTQPLPACPGAAYNGGSGCMDALKAQCPGGVGRVLGGLIEKGKQVTRTRLWLYDLASGQRIVRDDYCQQCDPDLDKVLAAHAVELLRSPIAEVTSSTQPLYCRDNAATAPATQRRGRLYLGVFGAFAGLDELRRELATRIARKRSESPVMIADSQRGTDHSALERLTGGLDGAQVLHIERHDGGKAMLTLWDQRARRAATRTIPCAASCLEPLSQAAAELQDLCFDASCKSVQLADLRPVAACEPLPADVCPALPQPGELLSTGRLTFSPGQAKAMMALTGVGVGLSVATSIGFWIVNEKHIQYFDGKPYGHPITPEAVAMTVLSASLVGLSVPVFAWLAKATLPSPGRRSEGGAFEKLEASRPPGSRAAPSQLLMCPGAPPDLAQGTQRSTKKQG